MYGREHACAHMVASMLARARARAEWRPWPRAWQRPCLKEKFELRWSAVRTPVERSSNSGFELQSNFGLSESRVSDRGHTKRSNPTPGSFSDLMLGVLGCYPTKIFSKNRKSSKLPISPE